jgi:hypothetical protein
MSISNLINPPIGSNALYIYIKDAEEGRSFQRRSNLRSMMNISLFVVLVGSMSMLPAHVSLHHYYVCGNAISYMGVFVSVGTKLPMLELKVRSAVGWGGGRGVKRIIFRFLREEGVFESLD